MCILINHCTVCHASCLQHCMCHMCSVQRTAVYLSNLKTQGPWQVLTYQWGSTIFYDVAVLTEQEVTKLIGLHPKDLKLNAATIINEEGGSMSGYCLSLKEMPLPEVFACRKLRLSRAVKAGSQCMLKVFESFGCRLDSTLFWGL